MKCCDGGWGFCVLQIRLPWVNGDIFDVMTIDLPNSLGEMRVVKRLEGPRPAALPASAAPQKRARLARAGGGLSSMQRLPLDDWKDEADLAAFKRQFAPLRTEGR